MSVVENEDDDELDIYSNLPNFHYDDSLQKLEVKNKLLLEKVVALQKQVTSLKKEFLICKQEKEQLAKNISSLYKSAKQEILRKDRQIGELSARNILLEQRSRSEKNVVHDRRNEGFSRSKTDRSVCSSEKVTKITNTNDATPTTHRYGTRSKSIKKREDEIEKKCKESKSVDTRKKKIVQKHVTPCSSRSNKDKSKSNHSSKAVSHSIRDSPSPEKLIIVENNLIYESNVEINEAENKLDSKAIHDEAHPVEKASPVVSSLPPFVGPKTTFSVRRYKQLYGVSPFKRAKLPLTGNNSLCSGPLKQAVPKNLFCVNKDTKAIPGDKTSDSFSGVSVIIPESSNKTDKSMIIPQLNDNSVKQINVSDSSSISKENLTSEKNSQKLKVIPVEYDFSLRKENIERITSKIKQNNYENSNIDSEPIYITTASYNKIMSCYRVEASIAGNELDRSVLKTSERVVNNCQYSENFSTSKNLQINRGNFPQVIVPGKSYDTNIKNKFIKVTAQIHADKDGGVGSGTKKEVCKVVPESNICVDKISLIDKVTSNSIHVDKILSHTEKEIDVVEKDKSSFTVLDKTKETCTEENGINEKVKNKTSDLIAVTRKDGENRYSSTMKESQIENGKRFVELPCSPDSCESFTLEITNSPEPFIEENTNDHKKSDNISSDKISRNETGAFSEISRTVLTQEGEIKNRISESVSVDLKLKQLSVEKESDKDCVFLKSSGEEQKSKSLLKDSIIAIKNVQSSEKHSGDVILSRLENIHLDKSYRKNYVKRNETDGVLLDVKRTSQGDVSLLKDLMTPEKKSEMSVNRSVNVNLSAVESDSSSSMEGYTLSPVKEKDSSLRDSLLKKQASPTKRNKNKYKNKEQQFKDLFGESPLKLDDTSSSCNENTGNNFNLFNSITPILTKIQNKESNKTNNLLNLDLSSHNDDLKIIHDKTSDFQNEKRILITPGVSKNFLDFKEAFQYGKTDAKNSSNDQIIGENNLKCSTSPSKNNSLGKENPNHSSGQKLSPVSSNIKNVLCDKSQKNNSNITVTCVKPNEPIKKQNQNSKDTENEKSLSTKFSPGSFVSEVHKKVAETSNIKNDVLKFSECTSLLSCEDSTIHMIKTFSKVGDSISPIKTPLKLSDVIGEQKDGASVGQTFQNTKPSETNNEIIYKKTSEGLLKISSNSRSTNNNDSTVSMIRNFSELNNSFVSPIKTPLKLNDNEKEQTPLDQNVIKKPVLLNDSVKSLTKSTEKFLTPMVIKKDGVSVCLSSEHCEFKRKRPIRKNIKFHNFGALESTKAKEFKGNTPLNCTKRKFENSPGKKTTIIDEPENKKSRIVCSSSTEVLPRQEEKEADDDTHKDQRKLNPVKNPECQKSDGAIVIYKKTEQNLNITKSNDIVNKTKSPLKQENNDKLEERNKEDKSKVQKGELNRIPNTFSRTVPCDSKNRSFLSPSVCERRSPSEYFNRQHRRRSRRDSFHSRRSNRRLSRLRSPAYLLQKHERKLEMKLRSEVTNQTKFKSQSSTSQIYQSSERKAFNRSEVRPKQMDKSLSSGCDMNSTTLCFPLKRLSVSPNVKETPSPVKPVEENHMEWKVVPLQINENSSNLIGKFVSHKIIPKFIGNLKNKDSIVQNQTDDVNQKNCDKISISVSKDKSFSKPGPLVFMRRTKRLGEAHLEDSKGFSPSISPNKKSVIENKIKANLTEDDKSTVNNNDQEVMNKKKQVVQKTRCIVKTPLDFKTQFGDIKVSSDDDLSISSSSEEESRHSDESWRPKKQRKLKKKC